MGDNNNMVEEKHVSGEENTDFSENCTEKPKKCPFCGGKGHTFQIPENTEQERKEHPNWDWKYPGFWIVGCWTEMCMGNINHITMVFVSEQSAVETWNTRNGRKQG